MLGGEARRLAGQPFDEGAQALITQQRVTAVVGQRQLLFAEQPVNLVVAGAADPERSRDALMTSETLLHVGLVVQGLGNQMMTRQRNGSRAQLAHLGLRR